MKIVKLLREVLYFALARFLPRLRSARERAHRRAGCGMLPIRLVQMAVAIAVVAASSQTEQGGPCAGTTISLRMAHTRAPARRPTCALTSVRARRGHPNPNPNPVAHEP